MSVTRLRLLALAAVLITPAALAADAAAGKEAFTAKCGICHATNAEPGGPVLGPNLAGVVGRTAGAQKDFPMYTPALKAFGEKQKWSAKTLDAFLKSPFEAVPGTAMPMPLPDDKERADVIAYLVTLK